MELLRNAVRPYAWGSRTAIAGLQGRPVPTDAPEAELWMGAHPDDPSHIALPDGGEQSLLEVLEQDPRNQLGVDCAERWSGRLPFLLKVLAAEAPLSLQVHPTPAQARAGFDREEAAGVPRQAPERNFPDPTAKPELLCALTEFHALSGFRRVGRTVELLRAIATPGLAPYADLLASRPGSAGLDALFRAWICLPGSDLEWLLPEVLTACRSHAEADGEFATECRTILDLGERYPRDAGVLAALLLNRVTLRPGEAIYLPAGNLHSYLRGTAVEILANSDNVLRCGLTPKHVDVSELLEVVDFADDHPPILTGSPDSVSGRLLVYPTEAEEFELSRLDWSPGDEEEVKLPNGRPQILLCTGGSAYAHCADTCAELKFDLGESIWIPASELAVTIRPGPGVATQVFRASIGHPR